MLSPASVGHTLAVTRDLTEKIQRSVDAHVSGKSLAKVMHYVNSSLKRKAFSSEQLLSKLKDAGVTAPTFYADIMEILEAVAEGGVQGRPMTFPDGSSAYRIRWRGFVVDYSQADNVILVHSFNLT